ncbi:MAG: sugar phosphate isomerase/epimerase [Haloarculaceae archaeon]
MATFDIGVQSVVYQDFSLRELLAELDDVDVDHLELWDYHLSPADEESTVADGVEAIGDSSVAVCGYGVVDLDDTGQAREHFAFADRLGAGYVTVNYPPARDDITGELVDLGNEFDLDVGVHNYSSVHHDDLTRVFSTMADVRSVLDRYDDPRLGLCVDTGHFLVEAVDPEAVLREFGPRVNSLHLKDTSDAEVEDYPGAGKLDVATVLALVDEHADLDAPVVVEYELPGERASDALRDAVANVRAALD